LISRDELIDMVRASRDDGCNSLCPLLTAAGETMIAATSRLDDGTDSTQISLTHLASSLAPSRKRQNKEQRRKLGQNSRDGAPTVLVVN
jgi:hypothetical protein